MPLSNLLLGFLCHTAHSINQQYYATQLLFGIKIDVPVKRIKDVSLVMQNAVISKHVYDSRTQSIVLVILDIS